MIDFLLIVLPCLSFFLHLYSFLCFSSLFHSPLVQLLFLSFFLPFFLSLIYFTPIRLNSLHYRIHSRKTHQWKPVKECSECVLCACPAVPGPHFAWPVSACHGTFYSYSIKRVIAFARIFMSPQSLLLALFSLCSL